MMSVVEIVGMTKLRSREEIAEAVKMKSNDEIAEAIAKMSGQGNLVSRRMISEKKRASLPRIQKDESIKSMMTDQAKEKIVRKESAHIRMIESEVWTSMTRLVKMSTKIDQDKRKGWIDNGAQRIGGSGRKRRSWNESAMQRTNGSTWK